MAAQRATRRPTRGPTGGSAGREAESADVLAALTAAVAGVGGAERAGQRQMAVAVQDAIRSRRHLLVQAGTGTGKSLAYLVPAVLHATESGKPVIVATATIALQRQLVERDLPLLADSLEPVLGRRPEFAILKGRHHYLCRHRLLTGAPDESPGADDGALFAPAPTTALGK